MPNTVVHVEQLSKLYRLGAERRKHETFASAVFSALGAPLRNLRQIRRHSGTDEEDQDSFWALRDVSFDVRQGEVLGIVGRNGAGKSTLLKVLSRITDPTRGRAVVHGRVGSLLEVGTGFHPELPGRDNIYLNGSILGMDRAYIDRKFDEIVEFAGIERFVDTPVKRYSSGMYVRLAFAVAAHLEPEVLIVDEVLAVGDVEFQQKCLGRMAEVGREGRTILFVSHNMAAVRTLCDRAILLRDGRLALDSDAETVIRSYLSHATSSSAVVEWSPETAPQAPEFRFRKGYILDDRDEYASVLDGRKPFSIAVEYDVLEPIAGLRVSFWLHTADGLLLCASNDPAAWPEVSRSPGRYVSRCAVPGYLLNAGQYRVSFGSDRVPYTRSMASVDGCLSFMVEDVEGHGAAAERLPGVLRPRLQWAVEALDREPLAL